MNVFLLVNDSFTFVAPSFLSNVVQPLLHLLYSIWIDKAVYQDGRSFFFFFWSVCVLVVVAVKNELFLCIQFFIHILYTISLSSIPFHRAKWFHSSKYIFCIVSYSRILNSLSNPFIFYFQFSARNTNEMLAHTRSLHRLLSHYFWLISKLKWFCSMI